MFALISESIWVSRSLFSLIVLTILISGIESKSGNGSFLRSNGLIFYDIKTNRTLFPPIVTSLKYKRPSRLPFIGRPCSCHDLNCGCCAGMTINQFNFNQHLCTNFTYDPNQFSIQLDVMMNENNLYTNMVSAKNPPPLCIPIPIPYIPLNTEMCVKLFDIFTPGRNLHMCMDIQMQVQKAPIIVLHFDCMRMGENGLAIVKPDQNGGLDLTTPQGEIDQGEVPGEVAVPQGPVESNPDPPQVDYETYDEVTEVKANN